MFDPRTVLTRVLCLLFLFLFLFLFVFVCSRHYEPYTAPPSDRDRPSFARRPRRRRHVLARSHHVATSEDDDDDDDERHARADDAWTSRDDDFDFDDDEDEDEDEDVDEEGNDDDRGRDIVIDDHVDALDVDQRRPRSWSWTKRAFDYFLFLTDGARRKRRNHDDDAREND